MQGVANFADGLLGGTMLVALAIVVAGPAFALLVLDSRARRADAPAGRRCLGVLLAAAVGLAFLQAAALVVRTLVLFDGTGASTLTTATWFRAGVARGLAAALVAGVVWRIRARRGEGAWGAIV